MTEWWSWILTAAGIAGLLLAGSKRKVGWLLGFCIQPVWLIFAIVTEQYGFILSAVAYGSVYARNWIRWRREERQAVRLRRPPAIGPTGGAGDSGASGR